MPTRYRHGRGGQIRTADLLVPNQAPCRWATPRFTGGEKLWTGLKKPAIQVVSPERVELSSLAPEASTLSVELRGHALQLAKKGYHAGGGGNKPARRANRAPLWVVSRVGPRRTHRSAPTFMAYRPHVWLTDHLNRNAASGRAPVPPACYPSSSVGTKRMDRELTQWRAPVGVKPSPKKTWPR